MAVAKLRLMLRRLVAASAFAMAFGAQAGAQAAVDGSIRLRDCIESPMAFVSIDAAAPAAAGANSPLAALLATAMLENEALQGLLGSGAAASAFSFVRGVLARASGEIEVALVGVLPSGVAGGGRDLPLVVVRTRLSPADAARLRTVLADPAVARPLRVLHGHATYEIAGREPAVAAGPGLQIEATVVGDDLIVANSAAGIDAALDRRAGDRRTDAAPRGLAADPRYVRLMQRLRPAPGALVAFADWRRLGRRLTGLAGPGGTALGWSGLGDADAMVAAIAAAPGEAGAATPARTPFALQSTVLLSFPAGAAINGWLGMVAGAPARQLLDDLSGGGLGGCVFAVEPTRLIEAAQPAAGFGKRVSGACGDCGLDLDRIVRRLGRRGALQLVLLGDGLATAIPAFAIETQNRRDAGDIVDEVARALGERLAAGQGGSSHVELGGPERLRLAAVDDLLVFAPDAAAFPALASARRERARARAQVEADVSAALRAFATDRGARVGGLVHLDLAEILAPGPRSAVGGDGEGRSGGTVAAPRGLPVRHAGLLAVETGAEGAIVRLHLLSR